MLSFTTPTSEYGDLGTFDGATFLLDLSNARVDSSVDFRMLGHGYRLAFADVLVTNGTFSRSGFLGLPARSVGVSGRGPSPGCTSFGCDGEISGLIASSAARAEFAYAAQDFYYGNYIFGAATFFQDPNGPLPPGSGSGALKWTTLSSRRSLPMRGTRR